MHDTRLNRKLKYSTAQRGNAFHSRRSTNVPSNDNENIKHRTTKNENVPHYHRLTLALSDYSGYTNHTHDQENNTNGCSSLSFSSHNVTYFDAKHNKQEEMSDCCSTADSVSSEAISQRKKLGNGLLCVQNCLRNIGLHLYRFMVFTTIVGCFYLSFFLPNNNTHSLRRLISAAQDEVIVIKGLPVNSALSKRLPLASEVKSLYGNSPIVKGMDQCQNFRNQVGLQHRQIVPTGLFTTGSGLLRSLINTNCFDSHPDYSQIELIDKKEYMNVKTGDQKASKVDHVLPIVIIQDPVHWMSSMCQYDGNIIWNKAEDRCPNIIPNEYDVGFNPDGTVNVAANGIQYSSLIDMWNKYYGLWMDDDRPRLIIRFEDLLFNADQVVRDVCQCAGWEVREKFQYVDLDTVGKDLDVTDVDVISAMSRHGSKNGRENIILYENERLFVQNETRKDLMTNFHYPSFQQSSYKPLGLFKMI